MRMFLDSTLMRILATNIGFGFSEYIDASLIASNPTVFGDGFGYS